MVSKVPAVVPTPHTNGAALAGARAVDDTTDDLAVFAKVVSHDFSSPLQAIRGFGALLIDILGERISESERTYLVEMIVAAERMQTLNEGLVTWVRARNAVLDVREVSLASIVDECLHELQPRIVEDGVRIKVASLPVVWADAAAIHVVVRHLLENALRYMEAERPPIIQVAATTSASEVTIIIQDNGLGISEGSRERAFGLFKRLEPSRQPGSIGVGLTLCRTIVERHGGRLWLDAAPEGGTRAIFTLPSGGFSERSPSASRPVEADGSVELRRLQNQAALAAIVESSDEAIFSKDLNGHIITWNRAAETLYGFSAAEVLGQHVSMLMAAERLPELPGLMDRVRNGDRTRLETVRMRKDRTLIDVSLTISPIRDRRGVLVGASIIARDITERHQTEEDLRAFLEVAPDAIVVIDVAGAVHAVNSQTERMFGYRADELMGQPLEMLLPPRFRGGHVAQRMAYTAKPVVREMGSGLELFGLRRDGTEFPVDIQLSTLPTKEGRLPVAAIRDITERRRLERLQDDFVSNAAHELRTPLTTLAGLGETLSRSFGAMQHADIADAFAAMARQGERARVLISNLLDLSNIEGGRSNFAIGDIPLKPLLNRALEAAPAPDGKNVTIAVASEVAVVADPDRLAQVVTNLLVNAYRYGGREIRIHALADPIQVILTVSDDGPGIEPDLVPELFEPFTRGRAASAVRGSGIGLALCRRILEGMNGEIRYEPMLPRGSRFRVTLRRAP
jgi:PAS domain S-box-containing protein